MLSQRASPRTDGDRPAWSEPWSTYHDFISLAKVACQINSSLATMGKTTLKQEEVLVFYCYRRFWTAAFTFIFRIAESTFGAGTKTVRGILIKATWLSCNTELQSTAAVYSIGLAEIRSATSFCIITQTLKRNATFNQVHENRSRIIVKQVGYYLNRQVRVLKFRMAFALD